MLRQVGLHQNTWMPRTLRCAAHSPVSVRIPRHGAGCATREVRVECPGAVDSAAGTSLMRASSLPATHSGTAAASGCLFLSARCTCSLFCCARAGDVHPSSSCGHGPLLSSLGCRTVRLGTRGIRGAMGGPGDRQRTRATGLPACSDDANSGKLTGVVTARLVNSKKCPRRDLNTHSSGTSPKR